MVAKIPMTKKGEQALRAELEKLKSEDRPRVIEAIAEAREHGDLKENAEYKAAREHQHFLNERLTKLQEELSRAVVFDPTTITTAFISFSTTATLHNNESNEDETYTILGPWESDPDNNVISYMSPFGNALMDKKTGERVVFTINDHNYDYIVKEIKAAKA